MIGKERAKPGPKKQFGPRDEIHLKFAPEILAWILEHNSGYQAYFDKLVRDDMKRHEANPVDEVERAKKL